MDEPNFETKGQPDVKAAHSPTQKEEKKLISKIKQALKAIGYSLGGWRQTPGVWLIWCDRAESYRSATIRLYRLDGTWELKRLHRDDGLIPLPQSHQVSKAIAMEIDHLRALSMVNEDE